MNQELIEKLPTIELYKTMSVPLRYMVPSDYNPNELKDDAELEALKLSLAANPEFFRARPILLNTLQSREGVIVGGEKRYRAALALGWESAPGMFVLAKTVEEEKAWNLLDNHHNGQIDPEKLQAVITDLHGSGFDMTSLGHTPGEITNIMSGMAPMTDPVDADGYRQNGTTPGVKYLECPNCAHTAPKKDFIKIDSLDDV